MRKTIRVKYTIILIGLLLLFIGSFILVNNILLENFYQYHKQQSLETAYSQINTELNKFIEEQQSVDESKDTDISSEDTSEKWKQVARSISENNNIKILVVNSNANEAYSSGDTQSMEKAIFYYASGMYLGTDTKLLARSGTYEIFQRYDTVMQASYMEMWGVFDSSYTFFMQTPLQSIKESADLSNRFLLYISLVLLPLGTILIYFVTRHLIKPILSLSKLAENVSEMNFETRYKGTRNDELGVLGNSINQMSEKLEAAITELKSANLKLQADIEEKDKIDNMRQEFIGNVSHELKTPIALIQGYAEGLKEGMCEDTENREFYCDVIMDEAVKMNAMVKQLLSLNQIETGGERLELTHFDLAPLIRGIIQSYQVIIQQKKATVQVLCEEPLFVYGDEFRIEEVISNYISNALNHLEGDRLIEIKAVRQEGSVRLSVFNTGTPIPQDEADSVWLKFYKVDKARTREYGGSGIGLSIVKAIMDMHGREYGIINHTNGVEFWIELDADSNKG